MLIRVVAHGVARSYIQQRAPSTKPLFIKICLNKKVGDKLASIDSFFLLDWWGQYQTYIARQVLPAKDKNGNDTFLFTLLEYNLATRRLIKRKLRIIYGVRHVADIQVQSSAESIMENLGLKYRPRPTLIGNRFL